MFENGVRLKARDLTLIVLKNESEHDRKGRVAFIAGKRYGNAVWRNRAKRRMRALYREVEESLLSYDVLFIAQRSINEVEYSLLLNNLRIALEKNGL